MLEGTRQTSLAVGDIVSWDRAAYSIVITRGGTRLKIPTVETATDDKIFMPCVKNEGDFFDLMHLLFCTNGMSCEKVALSSGREAYRLVAYKT